MGWLWLVGSLKSEVSFAKEPCKRDDILQKRLIISRSLLVEATPYAWTRVYMGGELHQDNAGDLYVAHLGPTCVDMR